MVKGYRKFLCSVGQKGIICSVQSEVVNGRDRFLVTTKDDDHHFHELSPDEQKIAFHWLQYNVVPGNEPYTLSTSYGLKHTLKNRTNVYMTNNQFKEAMLLCGCFPVAVDKLNWTFLMRKSSPICVLQVDKRYGLPMLGNPLES